MSRYSHKAQPAPLLLRLQLTKEDVATSVRTICAPPPTPTTALIQSSFQTGLQPIEDSVMMSTAIDNIEGIYAMILEAITILQTCGADKLVDVLWSRGTLDAQSAYITALVARGFLGHLKDDDIITGKAVQLSMKEHAIRMFNEYWNYDGLSTIKSALPVAHFHCRHKGVHIAKFIASLSEVDFLDSSDILDCVEVLVNNLDLPQDRFCALHALLVYTSSNLYKEENRIRIRDVRNNLAKQDLDTNNNTISQEHARIHYKELMFIMKYWPDERKTDAEIILKKLANYRRRNEEKAVH